MGDNIVDNIVAKGERLQNCCACTDDRCTSYMNEVLNLSDPLLEIEEHSSRQTKLLQHMGFPISVPTSIFKAQEVIKAINIDGKLISNRDNASIGRQHFKSKFLTRYFDYIEKESNEFPWSSFTVSDIFTQPDWIELRSQYTMEKINIMNMNKDNNTGPKQRKSKRRKLTTNNSREDEEQNNNTRDVLRFVETMQSADISNQNKYRTGTTNVYTDECKPQMLEIGNTQNIFSKCKCVNKSITNNTRDLFAFFDPNSGGCRTNCPNANHTIHVGVDMVDIPIECTSDTCNAGSKNCGNRFLEMDHHIQHCEKYQSNKLGTGVITKKKINKGGVIGQYIGIVCAENKNSRYNMELHSHSTKLGKDIKVVIDAEYYGNLTRFINHSCSPNCTYVPRIVNGLETIWVVAIKDIKKDDILTASYEDELSTETANHFFDSGYCLCGEETCKHPPPPQYSTTATGSGK